MIDIYISLFKAIGEADKALKEINKTIREENKTIRDKTSKEKSGYNSDIVSRVNGQLFTVEQTRQNITEMYQYFDQNDKDGKNKLSCLIIAILYTFGLVNNNIIIRFIPMQQDKEIVYSLSGFVSDGEMNQPLKNFISKITENETKRVIDIVNWETEYIREYVDADEREKIKNRFKILFSIEGKDDRQGIKY